ncbi:hypothetical protein FA101_27655 [Pseudomonas aeruginosa]|uniref:hypothetical protein n=1 Tax=Pseudomonas aeruginosa TaxID=287 RepID=UPI00345A2C20|nr:hypothetical protein [Pseudomonas aeruginosa]
MKLDPDEFVIHDLSRFPMCVFREENARPGYARQWEVEMEALLRNGQPFTVVYVELNPEENHEDRKHRGLWLKNNKAELGRCCKALISVEPDAGRRAAAAQQGEVAVKAFGIPHEAVPSVEEAVALTRRLTNPATLRSH